jgi:hypothetical protein
MQINIEGHDSITENLFSDIEANAEKEVPP